MSNVYSVRVLYSGKVQGVGFRYQTLQVAREFMVTGEVKNLTDGRVFLCAEGQEQEVVAFRTELEERMRNFIKDIEVESRQRAPSYKTFQIT